MQWIVWGILLIVLVSIAAVGLVFLTKRILPKERRADDVDSIGFVFAVVGVLYAIVLAFVVIDVWQKMTSTEAEVYREAHALVEQHRYAESLPAAQRDEIRRLSREYAEHVVSVEWPAMAARERPGIEGDGILDRLRSAVEGSGTADDLAYAAAVEQGQVLAEAREARLAAAYAGVPAVMWFVLIGGGLLMVSFVYVFDISGVVTQTILAVGLTVMTVLLLFSVYQFEYPFSRQLRIEPDAFEYVMARFGHMARGG